MSLILDILPEEKIHKAYHRNSGQGMELYSINDLEKSLKVLTWKFSNFL